MGAVWMRVRAELRARWRALVALGVLAGVVAGVVIAAAAGARRTHTAYPRFLAQQNAMDVLTAVYGPQGPPPTSEILSLAGVSDAAPAALFPVSLRTARGRLLQFPDVFTVVAPDGRFGSELNRFRIIEGRAPDQDAPDEVLIGFTVAERYGLRVGDELSLAITPDIVAAEDLPPSREELRRIGAVRVVGIGAMPGEFQPLAGANLSAILFTRGMERLVPALAEQTAYAVRFRDGLRDLEAFTADAEGRGYEIQTFFMLAEQTALVQDSIRFEVVSLWMLAAFVGLAGTALVGQSLVRQMLATAGDHPALRAVGMSATQLVSDALLRAGSLAIPGLVVAIAVSVACSGLFPVGLASIAEPDPGPHVDAGITAVGVGALLVVVAVAGWLGHRRSARAGATGDDPPPRPSGISEALARAGAPVPAVAGTRLALQSGRGAASVPVRSALVSAILAVAATTIAVTFLAGMENLIRSPRLSGWTFDVALSASPERLDAVREDLEREGLVSAAIFGDTPSLRIVSGEADQIVDFGMVLPADGPIRVAIAEGRAPAGAGEVALGRTTMADLRVGLGDTVTVAHLVSGTNGRQRLGDASSMRVVGRVITPFFGGNLGDVGQGAALAPAGFSDIQGDDPFAALYLRVAAGVAVEDVVASMRERFPDVFTSARKDAGVVTTLSRVSSVPLVLASVLVLMAVTTLGHALVSTVRRRRRDLAILRTLGLGRGDVRTTVVWQASVIVAIGIALGVPGGVAAGRWGWLAFADALGVVPVAVVPVARIAIAAVALVAVANVVAALPARSAARTLPAVVLRTE